MKSNLILLAIFLFGILPLKAQDVRLCADINNSTIQQFQNNHIDSVYSYFNDDMRSKLSVADLAKIWSQLEAAMGKYKGMGEPKGMQFEDYYQMETQLRFENKNLRYRLAFDKDNHISGMYFVPYKKKRKALEMTNNTVMREMPVMVKTHDINLPATLCVPKGKTNFPIVVFVHGSGANDRDETIGPNKPFRDLAHGLAELGIASLRYDKRSLVNPSTLMDIGEKSMLDAVVTDDALAAVTLAKTIEGVDPKRVFVLGHSLGAMMAPRIAQQNSKIKGVIMMAGNARPLEDVVYEQYKYLYNEDGLTKTEKAKLREVTKEVKNVKHLNKLLAKGERVKLPITSDVRFWKAINDYNQIEVAQSIPQPMLIMQGLRDYQVTPREYKIWRHKLHKKNNVSFKSYAKLNHLFLEGEGKSYPSEYEIKGNVPQYVISDIAQWVKTTK